ncbi:MAG TPA: NUDIX hydrolase [Steroidobacteraceae bacterium]|jgi:8-oxo-dGTP pyrophosphatase MutT (NUDIX family)|nr:NUDIX hydrolase [Steroidobacteraceae bacterium]
MVCNPEVTVAAVVMRDQRFLVVEERIAGRLVLNQPAGHLEDGETLLAAAIRETREETAWRFAPSALVGTYLWRNPDNGRSFLRFAFCGEVDDHRAQQPLDRGIVRALWLTPAELAAQSLRLRSPLVMRCIEDFLAGNRVPLDSVATLDLDGALHAPAVVNL